MAELTFALMEACCCDKWRLEEELCLLSFICSLYFLIFLFRDEVSKTRAVAGRSMVPMEPTSTV